MATREKTLHKELIKLGYREEGTTGTGRKLYVHPKGAQIVVSLKSRDSRAVENVLSEARRRLCGDKRRRTQHHRKPIVRLAAWQRLQTYAATYGFKLTTKQARGLVRKADGSYGDAKKLVRRLVLLAEGKYESSSTHSHSILYSKGT